MVPELEKPRITEIHVRIDCNGCVQKIKRALHGINGIYDMYIDAQQQKLTVIGWADPEKIIKAIKKTRKIATICSHAEAGEPQPPTPPPAAEGNPPAPDAANPPPTELPPAEAAAPPAEPAKEPPSENPPQEPTPPPPAPTDPPATPLEEVKTSKPKDVEEIHVIHHHPHQYGYTENWNNYTNGHRHEGPHYVTTHSYNNYRPTPHISAYVSDYGYPRSPPRNVRYGRTEHYIDDYHSSSSSSGSNGDGNNITSIFSDENPNACRIV